MIRSTILLIASLAFINCNEKIVYVENPDVVLDKDLGSIDIMSPVSATDGTTWIRVTFSSYEILYVNYDILFDRVEKDPKWKTVLASDETHFFDRGTNCFYWDSTNKDDCLIYEKSIR